MQQDSDSGVKGADLSRLPREHKRRFIPEQADLSDPRQVKGLYEDLLARPLANAGDIDAFLQHRDELEAAVLQHRSVLYIRMACQTDDAERASAYRRFLEQVQPLLQACEHQLNTVYLDARKRIGDGGPFYSVYDRDIKADVAIFSEKNIPLQTQEAMLSQDYQTVTGGLTAMFEGQEVTLSKLGTYLYEPDRQRRQNAWLVMADCYQNVADKLEALFDQMLDLRGRIARNVGFADYRDYKFCQYHRFDYTPEDCKAFHAAASEVLVPLQHEMWKRRADEMGLTSLRPWDLVADSEGQEPLRPFDRPEEFASAIRTVFERLDPELGRQFAQLQEEGLLDLLSRKGKAPGGFQCTLDEARKPFIFMNAAGSDDDVRVLLHESGHAFHTLACAPLPLTAYRHPPMEFCEVASMSMERLGGARLDGIYTADQLRRRQRHVAEMTVRLLLSVAANDAFQHWLYETPGHTLQQRREKWIELQNRFGQDVLDWSGLEAFRGTMWQRILHFFQVPFYYIEYGIAQLGALGIWRRALTDFDAALRDYKASLALGGSRSLPALFAAAGVPFDFSRRTIQQAADLLRAEWRQGTG